MANAPEGWYPDPIVSGQERWWTGEQWSFEYTRVEPTTPVPEDAAPAVAARARAMAPGWYHVEGDPDTERFYDGVQWTTEVRRIPGAPPSASPDRDVTDVGPSSDAGPRAGVPVTIDTPTALGIVVAVVVLHCMWHAVIRARTRRRGRADHGLSVPGVNPCSGG